MRASFFHFTFLLTLLHAATLSLRALSPVPYTEVVSCNLQVQGDGSVGMTIYDENAGYQYNAASISGGATSESAVNTAVFRPGKKYALSFLGSGSGYNTWLSFIVPSGYALFVDGTQTNMIPVGWQTTSVSRNYMIELRPDPQTDGPMAWSSFSGINVGKSVSWEVGLGTLFGERSAGRLIFKEYDLTNSPASRERLYLGRGDDTGEVWTISDAGSNQALRQVITPSGLIDLLDDGGGGYWMNFFASSQLEGSPGHPFILHGSPWKTIRVQSSSTQMTITETEGSVSRVSQLTLSSGSVSTGNYVWTLQEGDGSAWVRTTTHTSTAVSGTPASGGVLTTSGGYRIHTFTSGGTLIVSTPLAGAEAVIVAGGGGGGHQHAGGGGGGGVIELTNQTIAAGSYTVTVGGGGAGCSWYPYTGDNGGDSSFIGHTAVGGGGGTGMSQYGNNGGCGGGDGYPSGGVQGGDGVATQGWNGSRDSSLSMFNGGGGAGGAGHGANGGSARSTWAGSFSGGGGGGYAGGPGGGAGAGAGGSGSDRGGDATAGMGSGGGGGGNLDAYGGNGGSGAVVIRYVASTGGYRDDVVEVHTGGTGGTLVAKTKYHYENVGGWGEEVTQIVADPDTAALATSYVYYTNAANLGNYRRVRSVTGPTGAWSAQEYYDDWDRRGQLKYTYQPYLDAPASVPTTLDPTSGRVVYYEYSADWSGRYTRPTLRQEKINNVETAKTTWTHGDTSGPEGPEEYSTMYSYSDNSNYRTDYIKRYRMDAWPAIAGHGVMQQAANLTQDAWSRAMGDYDPSTGAFTNVNLTNAFVRYIVVHGSTSSAGAQSVSSWDGHSFDSVYLIPNQSTMDVVIYSPSARVRTETWVYTGSGAFSLMSYENLDYDAATARLTAQKRDSNTLQTNTYANGYLTSSVDVAGTETQFAYDSIGRVATSVKKGAAASGSYAAQGDITTTYTYDGANHATQSVTSGGALSLTATAAFDPAGRQTSVTAPGGYTTTYAYAYGGKIVTATLPGGATKITETYLDGQLKNVSGTGVVSEYHQYAIDGAHRRMRQSVYGGNFSAYVNTYWDWLGRQIEEWKPGWNGTNVGRIWTYNNAGQLAKFSQPGLADILYTYDTLGALFRTGLDLNANGSLDLASDDRITEKGWVFFNSGGWWRREVTRIYATAGDGTATQTAQVDQRLDLPANRLSHAVAYDIFGNATAQWSDVDRANKKITTTTDVPDSTTDAVRISYNGLPVSARDTAGLTTTYGYDALGRPATATDPRTGATTTAYVSGTSQVYTVTDPASVAQATYTYDSAGRVGSVKDALNKYAYTSYTARGEVYRTWGDITNPVEYGYDAQGLRTTMNTYRGGSGWTASSWPGSPGTADTTTWNYQAATNLLSSKTDAAGKSVSYTYTQAGQIATRTWARGIVTTYGYSATTGELTSVAYNDSYTPGVNYAYNRLGQQATVTDYTGTRNFTYNLSGTLELQVEELPAFYGDRRITREYDTTGAGTKGRSTGFMLGSSTVPGADQNRDYTYQADGRLATVVGGAAGYAGFTFTYGYVSNSHLIASITNYGYTDARSYDAYHDWTSNRTTTIGSATVAVFAYEQDDLGRVTAVTKIGDLFNRYGNGTQGLLTDYTYSDRSEVTAENTYLASSGFAVLTGRNNSFAYDAIGNRSSTAGTTHNGNSADYAANALNQYTQRTVPGVFDVAGAAGSGATVTVNGSSSGVTRQGEYFFKGQPMSNNPNPVSTSLSVSDGTTTVSLPAFTAGTPEGFAYDDDGNLTSDGHWSYLYDAENRLIWMQPSSAAATAGYPNVAFHLFYDYLGRRVLKHFYQWSGSAWTTSAPQERYIYDGWNLIARLDDMALVKNYFWGLDLSGSGQGAGGVGGLLLIQDGGKNYLPAYDAMGNLHGLINANTGSIDAAYEYDAFGQTIRESGSYAASNPFRFSTKYTDIETGLVYYGLRYYSPTLGRFINKDPSEEEGGLNLYAFCDNNGVNQWDYLGMHPVWIYDSPGGSSTDAQDHTVYWSGTGHWEDVPDDHPAPPSAPDDNTLQLNKMVISDPWTPMDDYKIELAVAPMNIGVQFYTSDGKAINNSGGGSGGSTNTSQNSGQKGPEYTGPAGGVTAFGSMGTKGTGSQPGNGVDPGTALQLNPFRITASAGVGFIPVVGEIQSWTEMISGRDYITGEPANRWLAGAGVLLGMVDLSGLTKAGKAAQLLKDARKLSPGELKALVGDIHRAKDLIRRDAELSKALKGENFDILVDQAGNAVLRTNKTGRLISTGVPPSAFHP